MESPGLRSILFASDLRESAAGFIASAAALAARTGAELHVVHAVEFHTIPYSAVSAATDYQSRVHDARDALANLIRRSLPAGVEVASQQVRTDAGPKLILERAREVAADLIVIGPARSRPFRGPILGNTADRLVGSVEIPVLVLGERSDLQLRQVVVPIDLADPARGAIDQGLIWASALGSGETVEEDGGEVRVLYVIPNRYRDEESTFAGLVITPQLQLEIEDAQQRVLSASNVRVRAETVWGDTPAEEIVRYVEQDTDLLVLGTHGYGAIGRALIGSVASKVVRAASCPMLLVPPAMWVSQG